MGWRTQSQAARARKRHRRNVAVEIPWAIDAVAPRVAIASATALDDRAAAERRNGRGRAKNLAGAGQLTRSVVLVNVRGAVAIDHGQATSTWFHPQAACTASPQRPSTDQLRAAQVTA